jgi:hypothetical protein
MKSLNLTREELYELVWEKPVSHLAEELEVIKEANLVKKWVDMESARRLLRGVVIKEF